MGSSEYSKTFVVGVNYPSSGCGRTAKHISFADKQSMKLVGQLFEYGIRAVQQPNKTLGLVNTELSTAAYRIPFYVEVTGSVSTKAGTGVSGVSVNFCHVDPVTAVNEVNADYCPLQTFITDNRGQLNGFIRVSNVNWTNSVEYFNVTASYSETMRDGTVIEHTFTPASQIFILLIWDRRPSRLPTPRQ